MCKTLLGSWAIPIVRMAVLPAVLLITLAAAPLRAQETAPAEAPAQADDDRSVIYRFDAIRSELVAVPRPDLKTGHIYSHFDQRTGRRVWSILQADGQFWDALGPGTTQPNRLLDPSYTPEEGIRELENIDQQFYRQVRSQGETVFMRLSADNQWVLLRHRSIPSIYNAYTNERWEYQFGRYIPVSHTGGYAWTTSGTRYVPLGRYVVHGMHW